ncbi:ubiquitin fusion degradaton protein [Capsaspora owczarzaki ATCC 30864]|uniref:Ubiquitin fusion degradaton protein n=1 Tax=Capsaspora owczarzaki (strain ATCC 30864) TaxID=595528 RepID=A0A0D2VZ41_CAPO3|nr:ubiquitin fusion degradaton protein [Capsaspora owczarzaki ATCC 30864]KJE97042.1 ubiquitin fusion degradaton protein [Capsaspora owczarzaki ATCC 30864]|eukprot:XP_004343402.2 ubiquitin fusion degradaton protein [Capsaspora owczarzaki ATCC 30864]
MMSRAFGSSSARFSDNFRCFPVAMLAAKSVSMTQELETGGKIILPPSALDRLTRLNISYPMLFEISEYDEVLSRDHPDAPAVGKVTHAGVLEFIAEPGRVYMPYWLMTNLGISEGSLVRIRSATLDPCSYTKFQWQDAEFMEISNPKAVLEKTLRKFACLTLGDTIAMHYNNKIYELRVTDLKPKSAVSIIECDMQVDFEAPPHYVEPDYKAQSAAAKQVAENQVLQRASLSQSPAGQTMLSLPEEEFSARFKAFSGSGARLDGKQRNSPLSSSPGLGFGAGSSPSRATPVSRNSAMSPGGTGASTPVPDTPPSAPTGIVWKKNRITFVRVVPSPVAGAAPAANANGAAVATGPQFAAFGGKGNTLRKN